MSVIIGLVLCTFLTNLELRQQQKLHAMLPNNAMLQDVNSAISPDRFVLNSCATATRWQCSTGPVYESFLWTSKEVYETSHDRC